MHLPPAEWASPLAVLFAMADRLLLSKRRHNATASALERLRAAVVSLRADATRRLSRLEAHNGLPPLPELNGHQEPEAGGEA